MSKEYSPGPWVAHAANSGEWEVRSSTWGICLVADGAGDRDYELGTAGLATESNARLIAAAPDLYGALLDALELVDQPKPFPVFDAEQQLRIEKIKAALIKATR